MNRGVTLLEVLLAAVLVAVIAVPVIDLFLASKKMGVSGRDRLVAMGLASSYLDRLKSVPPEELFDVAFTPVEDVPAPISSGALGLGPPPAGYRVTLTLARLELKDSGPPAWDATVVVEWTSGVSRKRLRYELQRLLPL